MKTARRVHRRFIAGRYKEPTEQEEESMNVSRKTLAIGGAIAALAVGGAGIAYAVSGDSEEQATGPGAEKAKAAALDAVGGGTVLEAEYQDSDGAGAYEVEVQRPDGSQVEVYVDDHFNAVGSAGDDDSGPGDDDGADDD